MTTTRSSRFHNEVQLRGRLSAAAEIKSLPSGDEVATWRLVIPRDADGGSAVDTIDCESYSRQLIRLAAKWPAGELIELEGALRRRFWQSPTGARSRYAVDVRSARRARPTKETHDRAAPVRAL